MGDDIAELALPTRGLSGHEDHREADAFGEGAQPPPRLGPERICAGDEEGPQPIGPQPQLDQLQAMGAWVAPGRPEKAFTTFQLGELHWNAGRVPEAVAAYRRASALGAGLRPAPGRPGPAAWAEGRTDEAIEAYRRVVDRLPAPRYVTELTDRCRPIGMDRRKSVSSLRTRRSK